MDLDGAQRITRGFENAACLEWVEYAKLDSRVGGERDHLPVALRIVGIVDEQPDSYTAVGSTQYRIHQQLPGRVALNREVLEIQRSLGRGYRTTYGLYAWRLAHERSFRLRTTSAQASDS